MNVIDVICWAVVVLLLGCGVESDPARCIIYSGERVDGTTWASECCTEGNSTVCEDVDAAGG